MPSLAAALALVLLLVLLEWLVGIAVINPFIVPKPSDVGQAFYRVIVEEHILERFVLTIRESAVAVVMVAVLGISAGVLLHRFALLRSATETWIAALASAPVVLMYPLFMVMFGRSSLTIEMMGLVAGLPPVILKTVEGLAGTRRVLLNVGASFKLSPRQIFWKIQLPSALPAIFIGLRLGMIFALINVVGVEFLINFGGLGPLINDLAERYDLPGTYAAISFVVLVSVIFFIVTERVERWLIRSA